MSGDNKPISGPKLSVVRSAADDPLDGSGAADAPDGWYEPDRLVQPTEAPGESGRAGPENATRIVDHLRTVLAARRDDV